MLCFSLAFIYLRVVIRIATAGRNLAPYTFTTVILCDMFSTRQRRAAMFAASLKTTPLHPLSSAFLTHNCFFTLCALLYSQGFAVGLISLGLSLRLGLTLILFYKSSSIITRVGFDEKARLTDDYKASRDRSRLSPTTAM